MNNNIILIGFMGTGKSTISKELHEKTGRKEIDLDAYITENPEKQHSAIWNPHVLPRF